ncbi:DUF3299 domain-containing protein [Cupriavidus sp. 30B13]|uniref:DUF3299 domain-containing protein n=1 Tax=Cupriavidus sp. 30B13 TaxID=3384241 RepID=UPI003B903C4B
MTRRTKAPVARALPAVAAAAAILALAVAGVRAFRPPAQGERTGHPAAVAGTQTQSAYAVGQPLPATATPARSPDAAFREIGWQALLPRGWDPMAPFKGLRLAQMADGDPRAQVALYKARQYWKNAPVEHSLDGAAVRLPGFVVSLGAEGEAMREFLLVPYFGACIHVPPPPANQVIHVRTERPPPGLRTMDTVWISGVMRVERAETMMGEAGYAMPAARVEPYLAPGGGPPPGN